MESVDRLEKVDQLRKRAGISYAEAADLLDAAGGDVLRALILHEQRSKAPETGPQWKNWEARGGEVLEKVKDLIKQGNVTRVVIRKDGRSVAEIPVTAGVIGAILAPTVALLGAAACLFGRCTIDVERRGAPNASFDVDDPDN